VPDISLLSTSDSNKFTHKLGVLVDNFKKICLATLNLKQPWWRPAACSLIFFLTGLTLLSYPGLQNDEALAAGPLYRLTNAIDHIHLFGHDIPTMLMAYLGGLKTWIYAIVLRLFAPSYISIRVPALLIGSASVWMLFLLMEKIHSRPASWIAALVLATDPMFILTTTFDWGPVALQHLLGICGIFFIVRFHQHSRARDLAAGCFCFGLGFWDKALFAWLFGGLAVAVVVVYPRAVLRALSAKNVTVAALSLCLGAAPLIAFNVTTGFQTFHSTAGFTTNEMVPKVAELLSTWDGSALFGYLAAADTVHNPRQPGNALERVSLEIHTLAGDRRRDGLFLASLASFLLLPFLWRTPAFGTGLFCLIALAVAWFQMAITRGAGAAHHVVLLWPVPMMLLGVVLAQYPQYWGKITLTLLMASNLLVTNQYLYQMARNGSPGSWTDAINSLAAGLRSAHAGKIAVLDWGMTVPLDVLDRGRLPLVWSYDLVSDGDTALLKDPGVLWLSHTDGNELFPGANARFNTLAQRNGYRKEPVALYYDRNGRAVFQTFRVTR
jgi:4-amino-4-deoxy-L-arabinose transferase-like glycosyltransferase